MCVCKLVHVCVCCCCLRRDVTRWIVIVVVQWSPKCFMSPRLALFSIVSPHVPCAVSVVHTHPREDADSDSRCAVGCPCRFFPLHYAPFLFLSPMSYSHAHECGHVTAVLCDTVDSDSSHAVVPKHFMTPLLLLFVIVSSHTPCCAAWLCKPCPSHVGRRRQ